MPLKTIKTNIIQVLTNKAKRASATLVITPNGEYFQYRGDRIKPLHFNLMLPIDVKRNCMR